MPKILQICVEGNTGSTGTIAESMGSYLLSHKWESFIAFGRYPRPSTSNLIRIGSDFEVMLHGAETRIFDRHGLGSRKATKLLIEEIEKIKPDIIQLHHLHGYYINIELLFEFILKSNIPVVWIFHDCWSFTGHCSYFDSIGCQKWKTECSHCPQKKEYPKSLLFDRSKKNFHLKKELFTRIPRLTIVSVSRWLDDLVSDSFFKNNNQTMIHNGIDLDVFKPSVNTASIRKKYNLDRKFVILGVATTWDKRKGLEDFVKLSMILKNDIVIVLVGLNNNQIKSLPSNVVGLPRTDNKKDLVDLYSAADVFLNLSTEETFGLTTVEAMGCGTPVIVYNRTASPELIDDTTGFVIEKDDFKGLSVAINTVNARGKEYYSCKCRNYAKSRFDKNDRFKEYLNLYTKILQS